MLLNELFERVRDPEQAAIDAAVAALHRRLVSKGDRENIEGYAFDIARSFDIGINARQLASLYRERYSITKENKWNKN
jgi:hypothetical protein